MLRELELSEAELWIGEMRGVVLGGEPLLVVRGEQGICVYRDRCPHQGYRLSEGSLENGVLTCRLHGHCFDAASGAGINPRGSCLSRIAARVEAGKILIGLDEAKP